MPLELNIATTMVALSGMLKGFQRFLKGTFLMQPYPKANAHHTVDFIRYLQQQRPGQKVLIF